MTELSYDESHYLAEVAADKLRAANEGLADQLDDALTENEELRAQLKEANRNYGRASETIGRQRNEIRSLRLEKNIVVRLYNNLMDTF